MKYRKRTEDFIVEEIAEHDILKKGKFKLYTLEKEGIETLYLLNALAQDNNIPTHKMNIAGIKDTHAKTIQYLTIPEAYSIKDSDLATLKFLGYVNEELQLGDLIANKFSITVREILEEELPVIKENVAFMETGLPNYFDSQRFGSVIDGEFIGKYLVKKEYEQAIKLYLTSIYSNDSEEVIGDKERTYASWPVLDPDVRSYEIKKVLSDYAKTKNWLRTFKCISKPMRLLFVSSYQSYLWNECVKALMIRYVDKHDLYSVPYVLGELVFNKVDLPNIPQTFQTMSHRIEPEDHEKGILQEVLDVQGLRKEQFNIRQTGNFFKSKSRSVMLFPTDFVMHEPKGNGNTYTVTVDFTIPKSCYATMVLKSIFGQ